MIKKRLLSGIQSSGIIHIGNYFGAIKQFVELQNDYESFVFIADFHSITTTQNKEELSSNILNVAMDYLACGLDPKKVHLFKQSDISEVTELTWYFNCITTMPFLERATAYKDANQKAKEVNVGLFDYPVLMAADILIQDADIVPVGADQKQHIEYARDIAQKFNNTYGETFKLPEAMIVKEGAIVPGIDGRKMSKSYKNTIPLFGTDEQIKKQVMSIVTDSKLPEESKNPDECNIFAIHKLFLNPEEVKELRKKYENGGVGYRELKESLYETIIKYISPMREKRKIYENNPELVKQILNEGVLEVKSIVKEKMKIIRKNIGVDF